MQIARFRLGVAANAQTPPARVPGSSRAAYWARSLKPSHPPPNRFAAVRFDAPESAQDRDCGQDPRRRYDGSGKPAHNAHPPQLSWDFDPQSLPVRSREIVHLESETPPAGARQKESRSSAECPPPARTKSVSSECWPATLPASSPLLLRLRNASKMRSAA